MHLSGGPFGSPLRGPEAIREYRSRLEIDGTVALRLGGDGLFREWWNSRSS